MDARTRQKYVQFTLALANYPQIGPARIKRLIDKCRGIVKAYQEVMQAKIPLINPLLLKLDDYVQMSELDCVCVWEDDYPRLLKQVADPPSVLFYRGNQNLLRSSKLVGIVGSRRIVGRSKQIVNDIVQVLVDEGETTVSGMAFGVDAEVHQRTLDYEGNTIAVIPGGVDRPVPENNRRIYHRILDSGGLILSEDPPGTEITKHSFPKRNRVIAGLAYRTIVVQAGEQSGAVITARQALEYNRDAFACMGAWADTSFQGNSNLVNHDCAQILHSAECLSIQGISHQEPHLSRLSEQELKIVESIRNQELLLDQIVLEVDKTPQAVISLLSEMEIKGIIQVDSLGKYSLKT